MFLVALCSLLCLIPSAPSEPSQRAYLKALNTDAGDLFGGAVATSGDTLVVGAPEEDSNASGVNGDAANNGRRGSGAAYVLVRQGATWVQQAYLKASNVDDNDRFGHAVGISGDTIVVGAPEEDSLGFQSGAIYVFVRNGTTWSQQAYLKASNLGTDDRFGSAVAISGDTIVVGASEEDSNATGIDGDEDNDAAFLAGAAYVFVRNGTTWSQQAYLKASNAEGGDAFGHAVSISGDTIAVGAIFEDSSATGVGGDEQDAGATASGAVYVFQRAGSTWSQQAYVKASNTGASEHFGYAVSVAGDLLVVGAPSEKSAATGIDGDQDDDSLTFAGAAYVFARQGTTWSQQAYLKPSDIDGNDRFGWAVAAAVDLVAVGAVGEDSGASGVDGDPADESLEGAGAAYVFARDGATWSQHAYLKASNPGAGDGFGVALAADLDALVVGAQLESSSATGVGGNEADDSAMFAGAAYLFDLDLDAWRELDHALAGAHGEPLLLGTGTLAALTPMSVALSGALESSTAWLTVGFAELDAPFKGGVLVPDIAPPGFLLPLPTDGEGALVVGGNWPAGVPSDFTTFFQYWIVDPAGPLGFSASNGLSGTTP